MITTLCCHLHLKVNKLDGPESNRMEKKKVWGEKRFVGGPSSLLTSNTQPNGTKMK